jgi:hypothetical protein
MVCIIVVAGKIEFGEKREIKWKGEKVVEAGSLTLLACNYLLLTNKTPFECGEKGFTFIVKEIICSE